MIEATEKSIARFDIIFHRLAEVQLTEGSDFSHANDASTAEFRAIDELRRLALEVKGLPPSFSTGT